MNVDENRLPVQADGDKNDQLARASELASAFALHSSALSPMTEDYTTAIRCCVAIDGDGHETFARLFTKPGLWVRYPGAPTNSTSADQIISALAYTVIGGYWKQTLATLCRCLLRLGFAQNYRERLNDSGKLKLPDFLLLRALPLFARLHVALWPVALVADLQLVFAAIGACGPVWKDGAWLPSKRTPDDVDDNVLLLTLLASRTRLATPLSRLACWVYSKLRPWNYGCVRGETVNGVFVPGLVDYHPVIGALRWYHRAETGGNPEIAEALIPAVERLIIGENAGIKRE